MAVGIMKAALFVLTLGLGVGLSAVLSISRSAAQGTAIDVAYVEAVSGRVVASSQGKPTPLDALDIIGDWTKLDLQANSELRICHYQTHKFLTLRGPLRVSISASGVMAENGTAINGSNETCVVPLVSTFQGGLVTRSASIRAMNVPLRPSINVVNRGTQAIRRIVLWDSQHQTLLMNFDHNAAQPILDDGQSYLLVVEQSNGSELNMMLRASAVIETGPLILVIR